MRFAVLFTTYAWDEFVERQYRRACEVAGDGDVYVIADESRGRLPISSTVRTLRTSVADISAKLGIELLTEAGWGKPEPLWWDLDYLTYRFFCDHQEYDYCVTMDHDACINADLSSIVKDMESRSIDFVAEPIRTPINDWYWTKPHMGAYQLSEIEGRLLCIMATSRRAANHLLIRRQEMYQDYKRGNLSFWPFCEVFIPVELKRAKFKMENLSRYGTVDNYDFRPLQWENDIADLPRHSFTHPVLDNKRYLKTLVFEHYPLSDALRPNSEFGSKLRRFRPFEYAALILREARRRLLNRLKWRH